MFVQLVCLSRIATYTGAAQREHDAVCPHRASDVLALGGTKRNEKHLEGRALLGGLPQSRAGASVATIPKAGTDERRRLTIENIARRACLIVAGQAQFFGGLCAREMLDQSCDDLDLAHSCRATPPSGTVQAGVQVVFEAMMYACMKVGEYVGG